MFLVGSSPTMSKSSLVRTTERELHEDQVPHLEEPLLVSNRTTVGSVLWPAVEVDLRAGPTRAWNAHVPVVVVQAATLDAVLGTPISRCQMSAASSSSS